MKKHISQMSEEEKDLLNERVADVDIPTVEVTKYTVNRIHQRFDDITLLDVAEVFLRHTIIEYNTNSGDQRILLRGTENVKDGKDKYNVCIVYSVRNNRLITAWLDHFLDNHKTLRIEEYTKDLDILEEL